MQYGIAILQDDKARAQSRVIKAHGGPWYTVPITLPNVVSMRGRFFCERGGHTGPDKWSEITMDLLGGMERI